jgi:hypothetical protein
MTVNVELRQAINESFRAVLVLTGSPEVAERAVANAIDDVGLDDLRNTVLRDAIRWAFRHTSGLGRLCLTLPGELQVLSLLEPMPRYCFVLRLLVGTNARTCSQILQLSTREVDEGLYQALLNMPKALQSAQCPCADQAEAGVSPINR